jgi:hypothetical protein
MMVAAVERRVYGYRCLRCGLSGPTGEGGVNAKRAFEKAFEEGGSGTRHRERYSYLIHPMDDPLKTSTPLNNGDSLGLGLLISNKIPMKTKSRAAKFKMLTEPAFHPSWARPALY